MKPFKTNTKLSLKKSTVARLSTAEMKDYRGRGDVRTIQFPNCTVSCRITYCTCVCTEAPADTCVFETVGPTICDSVPCPATEDCPEF